MQNVSRTDLALLQEARVLACGRLTSQGEPVRCLGSTFPPGPACLLTLFQAESAEAVRRVNESVHAHFISEGRLPQLPFPAGAPPRSRSDDLSNRELTTRLLLSDCIVHTHVADTLNVLGLHPGCGSADGCRPRRASDCRRPSIVSSRSLWNGPRGRRPKYVAAYELARIS